MEKHRISIKRVPATCGVSGHIDILLNCSCGGFDERVKHGKLEEVGSLVNGHKFEVIAEKLDLDFQVRYD